MDTHVKTLKLITGDYSQNGVFKYFRDFHIKNYILNIFEAQTIVLFEKISLLNLHFDEGFPDVVNGDKDNLLYILCTIF